MYTQNHKSKLDHTSYCLIHKQPWRSEASEGQGWAKQLATSGHFLKTYKLTEPIFNNFQENGTLKKTLRL